MSNKKHKDLFAKAKKYAINDNVKNGIALYGQYNDLPYKYLRLLEENVYHSAAVKGKAKFYQGDGLSYEEGFGDLPEFANNHGESWNDINEKICLDYSIFGGFGLVVIWDLDSVSEGSNERRISEVYHVGFDKIRAEEADEFGIVRNYYVAKNWKNDGWAKNKVDTSFAEMIPSFNPGMVLTDNGIQPKQLMVFRQHNPSSDYYPQPDYSGGIYSIILGSDLNKAKLSKATQSIIAGLSVKVIGNYSDEKLEELVNDLDSQMIGAINAGTPMITTAQATGEGVNFESIPNGDVNIIADFEEQTIQAILSAHNITFRELLGLPTEGGGLSAEQIEEKFIVFFNTVIRKGQQKILNGLNRVSPYIGLGAKFEINRVDLLEGLEKSPEVPEIAPDDNITDEEENSQLNNE